MITSSVPYKKFTFPVGEMQVNLMSEEAQSLVAHIYADVTFHFERTEEIFELMLLCDALTRDRKILGRLLLPYVPFSRQDRVNHAGESFSLKVFADAINSLGFQEVVIHDPHSDVSAALIHNAIVVEQWELVLPLVLDAVKGQPFYLVSPDAGALKKIHKLALKFNPPDPKTPVYMWGVVECGKLRDTRTGEITGTVVHNVEGEGQWLNPAVPYVIVDDIIDGGRTFIELAKALRAKGAKEIHLVCTHGFFTKGKNVFDGLIDGVHVANDQEKKL